MAQPSNRRKVSSKRMLNSSSEVVKTQRWRGAREQMQLLRHLLLSVEGPWSRWEETSLSLRGDNN